MGTRVNEGLIDLVKRDCLPLYIQPVFWSRYNELYADYADCEGHAAAADALALQIHLLHKECPTARIVLVSFSAGSRIVLLAAEKSPAHSIDRIVLLSATMSCYYDLRQALRATRGGIDNFHSIFDLFLQMTAARAGTSDGLMGETAGRFGFWLPGPREHYPEYCGLRQYQWREAFGGQGGHLSFTRYDFLKGYLAPLLLTPAPQTMP
jgi:pimeloyl-ACP methyl ester carboxylesterase